MAISPQLDVVQRLIITQHREKFEESPSPMKVQKLCYYAQGFLLAQGYELFPDEFQAWQHGPVIPDLYYRYSAYSWRGISEELTYTPGELAENIAREIIDIVAAYGRYDGAALSTMTHREAPWLDARGELAESERSTLPIPKASLRAFFASKLANAE